jgi:hypothetical protein
MHLGLNLLLLNVGCFHFFLAMVAAGGGYKLHVLLPAHPASRNAARTLHLQLNGYWIHAIGWLCGLWATGIR